MPLTPEEIETKDFLITLRGYDKDEVRAFLSAVGTDYKRLEDVVQSGGAMDPFQAIGEEVSQVLAAAKESADRMRRSAQEEASALRRKVEEETTRLQEEAQSAARTARDDAERYSVEVRAAAEKEAEDRIREAEGKVDRLKAAEQELRQRLYAVETMLQTVRQDLAEPGAADEESPQVQQAERETPPEPPGSEEPELAQEPSSS